MISSAARTVTVCITTDIVLMSEVVSPNFRISSVGLLCAWSRTAGTETLATQYRPSRRGLERHRVRLTTLIAGYIEPWAISARSLWTTKIGPPRITTRFATLRVTQVPFSIVVLLPLREGEGGIALCAHDFNVCHDSFLHESTTRGRVSVAVRSFAISCFTPEWSKSTSKIKAAALELDSET